MTKADQRFDKLLEPMPKRKSAERETRNPLPEKDYTHKQQPLCDDEENDPEIDGR